MENKLFWKDEIKISLNPLQVLEGAADGLRELTKKEIEDHLKPLAATSEEIRLERDQKLRDSDWTQVSDAPVNKAAWSAYRQELRDITEQHGFPVSVVWPIQPNS